MYTVYAGLAGYMDYSVVELTSGMVSLSTDMSAVTSCIEPSTNIFQGQMVSPLYSTVCHIQTYAHARHTRMIIQIEHVVSNV